MLLNYIGDFFFLYYFSVLEEYCRRGLGSCGGRTENLSRKIVTTKKAARDKTSTPKKRLEKTVTHND